MDDTPLDQSGQPPLTQSEMWSFFVQELSDEELSKLGVSIFEEQRQRAIAGGDQEEEEGGSQEVEDGGEGDDDTEGEGSEEGAGSDAGDDDALVFAEWERVRAQTGGTPALTYYPRMISKNGSLKRR